MGLEQRTLLPIRGDFTTREAENDLYIEGYFAVFNSPYVICQGVEEVIAPGAFADTLGGDIRALTNHDTRLVLGRTKAGTLTLREDSHGLWGSIKVNRQDADAMNTYSRVQRGDVDQCSMGFYIQDEGREVRADNSVRYTIRKADLAEVTVCTFPAYEATSISARMRQEEDIRQRALEEKKRALREKLKGS